MEANINFDEASKLWRENKQYLGNGSYKYICMAITKKNTQCLKKPLKNCKYCHIHNKITIQ